MLAARQIGVSLVLLLCLGAACKRSDDKPVTPQAPVMKGVAVQWQPAPGFAAGRFDKAANVIVFPGEGATVTVKVRRFKRAGFVGSEQEGAAEVLQSLCPKPPCKIAPLKPGYWQSHYELQANSVAELHWDVAAFPNPDLMIVAEIVLRPATPQMHKTLDATLKELRLIVVPEPTP